MTVLLAVVFTAILAVPAGWILGYRAHARTAAVIAEATARPAGPHPAAVADEIALGWQALDEACCLRWWVSAETEHDPHHCTRKDQNA